MLMITVEAGATTVTLRLSGRLAGAGVRELARNWSAAASREPHRRVLVDLTGVTSVDGLGRQFLRHAHRRGDALVGGAATTTLVDEIRDQRQG